jgi:DNA-binding transcriptional ArsR family regulator
VSTESHALDLVFGALADPTRRAIFEAVAAHGPTTATRLKAELPVTRQAIAKHLSLLADAGLVTGERIGRETQFRAEPERLAVTNRWVARVGADWDRRLTALADAAARRGERNLRQAD